MPAIKAIGCYIPETRLDNVERAAKFGRDAAFVADKLGPLRVARKAADEDTSDLAVRAVQAIQGFDPVTVDGLIVCTQNPDGHGLPHTSAILQARLGLPTTCAAFDIGLGCSGYVYGLAIARSLMETYGLKSVLLVTSDPYSKIVDDEDLDTALLFGDAAAATWITVGPGLAIGPARFATDGAGADHLKVNAAGHLVMHGREIFNFTARAVPEQIAALLADAGLDKAEVDSFLLHQGSRYIVRTIQQRLGVAPEKVPIGLTDYGNAVSSSIPLILAGMLDDTAQKRIVLSGFGVGLSMASMILERT
jgi:3-oxoacyl-[acyl-carrier-protein] synthase-3